MKAIAAAICGIAIFASSASASDKSNDPASSPAAPQNWTTTFSTEARFFSWRTSLVIESDGSSAAGKGWQFYAPFAVQLTGKPIDTLSLDFIVRGGWVKSVQTTSGHSGEVHTPTDTVVSG